MGEHDDDASWRISRPATLLNVSEFARLAITSTSLAERYVPADGRRAQRQ